MSSNGRKQGPDFICIGAQKAGTTWLYDQLVHHPQVWLPVIKELHYFNFEKPNPLLRELEVYPWGHPINRFKFLKDRPDLQTVSWLFKYNFGKKSPRWYRSLFPSLKGKITGELTPAYSTLDEYGVEFVRDAIPEHTKVFIILRNPIDRIWSGAKMDFRWRNESPAQLQENAEKELIRPTHMLRSAYSNIIPMWQRHFGDRFGVFFYDDLEADPHAFLGGILSFLGVDSNWISPAITRRSNSDEAGVKIPPGIKRLLNRELKDDIAFVMRNYPEKGLNWGEL